MASLRKFDMQSVAIQFDDASNSTYTGKVNLTLCDDPDDSKSYDASGAAYYVVAVVLVYGLSMVLLIASLAKRKMAGDKDMEENQIHQYLHQVPSLREKTARDAYRKLKKNVIKMVENEAPMSGKNAKYSGQDGQAATRLLSGTSSPGDGRDGFELLNTGDGETAFEEDDQAPRLLKGPEQVGAGHLPATFPEFSGDVESAQVHRCPSHLSDTPHSWMHTPRPVKGRAMSCAGQIGLYGAPAVQKTASDTVLSQPRTVDPTQGDATILFAPSVYDYPRRHSAMPYTGVYARVSPVRETRGRAMSFAGRADGITSHFCQPSQQLTSPSDVDSPDSERQASIHPQQMETLPGFHKSGRRHSEMPGLRTYPRAVPSRARAMSYVGQPYYLAEPLIEMSSPESSETDSTAPDHSGSRNQTFPESEESRRAPGVDAGAPNSRLPQFPQEIIIAPRQRRHSTMPHPGARRAKPIRGRSMSYAPGSLKDGRDFEPRLLDSLLESPSDHSQTPDPEKESGDDSHWPSTLSKTPESDQSTTAESLTSSLPMRQSPQEDGEVGQGWSDEFIAKDVLATVTGIGSDESPLSGGESCKQSPGGADVVLGDVTQDQLRTEGEPSPRRSRLPHYYQPEDATTKQTAVATAAPAALKDDESLTDESSVNTVIRRPPREPQKQPGPGIAQAGALRQSSEAKLRIGRVPDFKPTRPFAGILVQARGDSVRVRTEDTAGLPIPERPPETLHGRDQVLSDSYLQQQPRAVAEETATRAAENSHFRPVHTFPSQYVVIAEDSRRLQPRLGVTSWTDAHQPRPKPDGSPERKQPGRQKQVSDVEVSRAAPPAHLVVVHSDMHQLQKSPVLERRMLATAQSVNTNVHQSQDSTRPSAASDSLQPKSPKSDCRKPGAEAAPRRPSVLSPGRTALTEPGTDAPLHDLPRVLHGQASSVTTYRTLLPVSWAAEQSKVDKYTGSSSDGSGRQGVSQQGSEPTFAEQRENQVTVRGKQSTQRTITTTTTSHRSESAYQQFQHHATSSAHLCHHCGQTLGQDSAKTHVECQNGHPTQTVTDQRPTSPTKVTLMQPQSAAAAAAAAQRVPRLLEKSSNVQRQISPTRLGAGILDVQPSGISLLTPLLGSEESSVESPRGFDPVLMQFYKTQEPDDPFQTSVV